MKVTEDTANLHQARRRLDAPQGKVAPQSPLATVIGRVLGVGLMLLIK